MLYYRLNNQQIRLDKILGSGGEATVYELQNDPHSVAKIYHTWKCPPAEKLQVMVKNPPDAPTRSLSHVSIAWMTDLIQDGTGQVAG